MCRVFTHMRVLCAVYLLTRMYYVLCIYSHACIMCRVFTHTHVLCAVYLLTRVYYVPCIYSHACIMCRVFTHTRVLCAVYLLTCVYYVPCIYSHARWITVGDTGPCCCVHATSFQAQIDLVYWNCLKGNTEVNLVRQGGAHHLMGFPWACRYCLEVNMHTRTYPNQPLSHMQCVYIPLNHSHTCRCVRIPTNHYHTCSVCISHSTTITHAVCVQIPTNHYHTCRCVCKSHSTTISHADMCIDPNQSLSYIIMHTCIQVQIPTNHYHTCTHVYRSQLTTITHADVYRSQPTTFTHADQSQNQHTWIHCICF